MDVHSSRDKSRFSRFLRVGLQLKSVLILTLVVIGVTSAGGWLYFQSSRNWLHDDDHLRASRLAKAMEMSAQDHLAGERTDGLEHLAADFVRREGVLYVAVLNQRGEVVASASNGPIANGWSGLTSMPLAVSNIDQLNMNLLTLARPILARDVPGQKDRLVGAVRLVLDTGSTSAHLAKVQQRIWVIAAAIVLCSIPLGYLMVWRAMVQPVRQLVATTRRIAQGDFTARSGLKRNDETGELASALDSMADEVASMRDELVLANEMLEKKIEERTSELRDANRRLRGEIAEKEDFLRAVSHDLNAPLRNIAGMATMVMVKWQDRLPEDVVARLQRIQANVDAETSLIDELLELSRIRSQPQKRQVMDIGKLLKELAATLDFELKSRSIELNIDESMPTLYVEKNRIRQVFQNLIDNAIKYMHRPVGGRIDIRYRRSDGMHQFSVADNGPGIPPEDQQKIFFVFRRAETAATSKVEGKGVGLAVVKTTVANYDGTAWVQSELGHGATFFVTLAAHCTQPPSVEEEGSSRSSDPVQAGYAAAGE